MSRNNNDFKVPVLPYEGLIRIGTILAHYPISKSQLYKEIAEGRFPKQKKVGSNTFWDAKEFREFLQKHGAEVVVSLNESSSS